MATDLIMPTPAMATDQHAAAAAFYHPHHHQPAHNYHPPLSQQQQQHPLQQQPLPSQQLQHPMRPQHQRSQSHHHPHQHAPSYPQISPLSTSQQTAASSPTSPKSYHARQVRPMYMPAVLRPNEFPSKAGAGGGGLKGLRDGDLAGVEGEGEGGADDDARSLLRRSNSSFISLPGLTVFGGRLTRRSTAESGKGSDADWDLELFPKVTAEPTRKHWKPDPESTVCDDPTCKRKFNYFTRRHHCRKCGNIFCDFHSAFDIPLDQDANYNPRGSPSRSCSHCFQEFRVWRSRNNSQASSATSSETTRTTPTSPIVAGAPGVAGKGPGVKGPDAAASVPRDWNWSTF